MRANTMQTNFTSGEISPQMYGRVDVNKYMNGAKMLRNFIVRPQGGVCRRPGTQYLTPSKDSAQVRLVPFVVSNNLAYVLEFGDQYIRLLFDGSLVVDDTDTIIEIPTPYAVGDLDQLYFSQSADILFIAHPGYPPKMLIRNSIVDWDFDTYSPADGPYLPVDRSGNILQVSVTSDITTLISSSVLPSQITITASAPVFTAAYVGNYVLTTSGPYIVTGVASPTLAAGYSAGGSLGNVAGLVTYNAATHQVTSLGSISFASLGNGLIMLFGALWLKATSIVTPYIINVVTVTVFTSATFTVGSTITTSIGSPGRYIDFQNNGRWSLCQIISSTNNLSASVLVIDNILNLEPGIDIKITSGAIGATVSVTTSFSGVFDTSVVGKYVRDTNAQRWVKITTYTSSSALTGTLLDVVAYVYPGVTFVLQNDRVITVTVSSRTPIFDTTDVGRLVRLQFGSHWRWVTILTRVNSSKITGHMDDFLPLDVVNGGAAYNNGNADDFRLGSWSQKTGYPGIVCLHEQRLIWANTVTQPETLWLSVASDYMNMAPTEEDGSVVDTNAIDLTLASGNANPITWMRSGQVLLVGTYSGEYEVIPPGNGGISPTNISAQLQSAYGSLSPTVAYNFGTATLFLQRGGSKLREMVFQFQYNAFNSKDISIISEHIMRVRGGAKSMDYQLEPIPILWIICNNGDLVSCTYDKDQDIVAFSPHTLGGGLVESMAIIPGAGGDEVYFSVRRSIPNEDDPGNPIVRYLEKFAPFFDSDVGDLLEDAVFSDCSITYSGVPTHSVPVLHLLGTAVVALADGVAISSQVVDSHGNAVFATAASKITIGINCPSTLGMLSPEGASQVGTSQGKRKAIKEMSLRVKDALPCKQGPSLDKLDPIDAANFGGDLIPLAQRNKLFTGDVRFSADMAWDTQATMIISQDRPYPLTVESLMPILASNE